MFWFQHFNFATKAHSQKLSAFVINEGSDIQQLTPQHKNLSGWNRFFYSFLLFLLGLRILQAQNPVRSRAAKQCSSQDGQRDGFSCFFFSQTFSRVVFLYQCRFRWLCFKLQFIFAFLLGRWKTSLFYGVFDIHTLKVGGLLWDVWEGHMSLYYAAEYLCSRWCLLENVNSFYFILLFFGIFYQILWLFFYIKKNMLIYQDTVWIFRKYQTTTFLLLNPETLSAVAAPKWKHPKPSAILETTPNLTPLPLFFFPVTTRVSSGGVTLNYAVWFYLKFATKLPVVVDPLELKKTTGSLA